MPKITGKVTELHAAASPSVTVDSGRKTATLFVGGLGESTADTAATLARLQLLRDAFANDWSVSVDYGTGAHQPITNLKITKGTTRTVVGPGAADTVRRSKAVTKKRKKKKAGSSTKKKTARAGGSKKKSKKKRAKRTRRR